VALLAITLLVARRATRAFDLAATETLQSVASGPLDVLANANTLIGQASVTVAIAALLAFAAWRRGPPLGWLAAGLFVLVGAVGVALKLGIDQPAPPDELLRAFWNPLSVLVSTPSSFPSGHVARVTFLAVFAAVLAGTTRAKLALAAVVAYTFWARVYVGHHWISDAVGGIALGIAAGGLAAMWIERCRRYARPA
jgi:undecaprenyl-diphosphatase